MYASIQSVVLRILNLMQKEFKVIFNDPANRIILFVPVFVQSLLFGYAATFDLNDVPYVVIDQSQSAPSQNLLAHLDSTGVFHRIATLQNADQIAAVIDRQDALLAIQIPADFERLLVNGQNSPVQVILDARNSSTAGMAAQYLSSVVGQFNQDWRVVHGGSTMAIQMETRAWYNPNLESRWNIIPALIASLAFLQTLMMTALSVAREREQGTFDMLMVTPMSPYEIMAGKALAPVLIGVAQSIIVLLISIFWFHIPFAGSVLTLLIGLLIFTISSVGIGLAISALSANMQQAMLYSFVLLMPLMLLSGLMPPVKNMPTVLQWITYANPLRFAMDFVRRVYLEGASFALVAPDLVPMLLVAAITLPCAAWLFRNRLV